MRNALKRQALSSFLSAGTVMLLVAALAWTTLELASAHWSPSDSTDAPGSVLVPVDGPLMPPSRYTYGYFGGGSEAEDQTVFDEECPAPGPTPSPCPGVEDILALPETLARTTTRILIFQRIREKLIEYSLLNQLAFSNPRPTTEAMSRPSCLSEGSDLWHRMQGGFDDEDSNRRIESLQAAHSNENLAFVVLHRERLSHALTQRRCFEVPRATGVAPGECAAIQREKYRLEAGYPGLFWSLGSQSVTVLSGYRPGVEDFLLSVYRLIGSSGRTESESPLLSIERGRTTATTGFSGDLAAYGSLVSSLESELARPTAGLSGPAQSAREELERQASGIRESLSQGSLESVCRALALGPGGGLDALGVRIGFMSVTLPNLLRQAMLDSPPKERALLLRGLCELRGPQGVTALDVLRPNLNCAGVKRRGSNVQVARREYGDTWPMSASADYFLEKGVGERRETVVRMTLNLMVPTELTADARNQANLWAQDLNAYFNCQVGAIASSPSGLPNYSATCPPSSQMRRDPPVRFELSLNVTSDSSAPDPKMRLTRCYRHELNSSDCAAIRRYLVDRCVTGGTARESCEASVPPEGDSRNNRENASNVTLGSHFGTLRHEVAHRLGVPDEYVSPPYDRVMNLAGEHDSLMNNHRATNARLYPRHLERILSVQECRSESPAAGGAAR